MLYLSFSSLLINGVKDSKSLLSDVAYSIYLYTNKYQLRFRIKFAESSQSVMESIDLTLYAFVSTGRTESPLIL